MEPRDGECHQRGRTCPPEALDQISPPERRPQCDSEGEQRDDDLDAARHGLGAAEKEAQLRCRADVSPVDQRRAAADSNDVQEVTPWGESSDQEAEGDDCPDDEGPHPKGSPPKGW